jgi:hypothetical protein
MSAEPRMGFHVSPEKVGRRWHSWARWAAVAFVLGMVAWRWDARTGFTGLIRFGDEFAAQRLPEVQALPVRQFSGGGYDGQFYAQLAVRLDPRDPQVQSALDNPRYRARRILLPAVAHVLGWGNVRWQLNLYALLNTVAWLLLGWRLRGLVAPLGGHGTAIWLACMLSLGALDSVRLSLTDLPAMLFIVLALEATLSNKIAGRSETGPTPTRCIAALTALALAGLTRETSVLAAALTSPAGWRERRCWGDLIRHGVVIALPLGLWLAWLQANVPAGGLAVGRNFDWPALGVVRHAFKCGQSIATGQADSREYFGLLAVISLGWQSISLLRRWADPSPWMRIGLPFAVLFWSLGDYVWSGYWAVARTCLPLAFAYNFLLPRDRSFAWRFALGNACALHGIYRMLPG